jgi:hypothetical protein
MVRVESDFGASHVGTCKNIPALCKPIHNRRPLRFQRITLSGVINNAALRQAIASLWHRQGVRVFERVEERGVEVVDCSLGQLEIQRKPAQESAKASGVRALNLSLSRILLSARWASPLCLERLAFQP